jgi:hypothetical protein
MIGKPQLMVSALTMSVRVNGKVHAYSSKDGEKEFAWFAKVESVILNKMQDQEPKSLSEVSDRYWC